jgi:DUF971 family protein
MAASSTPWPTEIKLTQSKDMLAVSFDDGACYQLPTELLRVMSPSAEVQGHSPEQRVTVGGKRRVKITSVEPVGNYAVRLVFDDGHATGLFTWAYLHKLGKTQPEVWSAYLAELKSKGLSRD